MIVGCDCCGIKIENTGVVRGTCRFGVYYEGDKICGKCSHHKYEDFTLMHELSALFKNLQSKAVKIDLPEIDCWDLYIESKPN